MINDIETYKKVIEWIVDDNTGMSSMNLACFLLIGKSLNNCHPHDPSDLNRCIELLEFAPELKKDLYKMKTLSKEWEILVDNWDLLTNTLNQEKAKGDRAPKTYDLMNKLLRQ